MLIFFFISLFFYFSIFFLLFDFYWLFYLSIFILLFFWFFMIFQRVYEIFSSDLPLGPVFPGPILRKPVSAITSLAITHITFGCNLHPATATFILFCGCNIRLNMRPQIILYLQLISGDCGRHSLSVSCGHNLLQFWGSSGHNLLTCS